MKIDRRTFGAIALSSLVPARATGLRSLTICCSGRNDVYRTLRDGGIDVRRFDSPADAIAQASPGSGILLMSDAYPERSLSVSPDLLARAAERKARIYIEYTAPAGSEALEPKVSQWERAVVASDFFGRALLFNRILSLHQCRYLPFSSAANEFKTHLALARVAGYDTAVYGIPDKGVHPLLVESGNVLTATSQLSRVITARYAPTEAWALVWKAILAWLFGGEAPERFEPARVVRPAWPRQAKLPRNAESDALRRGVQWYYNARLFVHPSWAKQVEEASRYVDQVGPAPAQNDPVGDGSLGMLEGHDSRILADGSQNMRWWIRADCIGETAMVLALANKVTGQPGHARVANNLLDYLLNRSRMASGSRMNPQSPSYGLIGWNNTPRYHEGKHGYDVYYGDDIARCLLGMFGTIALTGETRWLARFWLAVLGSFRLIGRQGHQRARHEQAPLEANGWRHYNEADTVLHDMNYQAYPWALYLLASTKTNWEPFADLVEKGIRLTIEAYPAKWRWSNSITSSQSRILLPLAWLIRVRDTAEHREWLRRITSDLLARLDSSGAIPEWTGIREMGIQMPPASNEAYGTGEGTLIQTNGDTATDLLYCMNFAFIGVHEAFAATGEQQYKDAENKLADFLVRAQARSEAHPEFNGAWFRAFDYGKWDYWASSSDNGWGAWCTESGWSQSWITTTFALRLLKTSLWELMENAPSFGGFNKMREEMFPA
jgi:hypothetical protein